MTVSEALGRLALDWVAEAADLHPPLAGELVAGGRSNLTFMVADAHGRHVVVRRPPLGHLLPKAHDVGREYRLLTALAGTEVPVPRPIALCLDPAILDVPFYVMARLEGEVLKDVTAAERVDPDVRRSISFAMVDILASLHRLDPSKVGLGDLATPSGFPQRLLTRWKRQLEASAGGAPADLLRLHDDLMRDAPRAYRPGIVHGDFRLENCVVDGRTGCIVGVLDWELCTLGDPIADLGYWLMYWGPPVGANGAAAFPELPSRLSGFATRGELLERYLERTGSDASAVLYYWALAHWKLACILHGTHERFAVGNMYATASETKTLALRATAMAALAADAFATYRTGELP